MRALRSPEKEMKHPKHVESLGTLTVIQMNLPITFGKLSAARKTQMNQRSKAVYSYIADHGGTETGPVLGVWHAGKSVSVGIVFHHRVQFITGESEGCRREIVVIICHKGSLVGQRWTEVDSETGGIAEPILTKQGLGGYPATDVPTVVVFVVVSTVL